MSGIKGKSGIYIRTAENRENIRKVRTGTHLSEETKKKLSLALKGRKRSEEFKRKISELKKGNKYCLGRKHSIETRIKMSNSARKGKKSNLWKGGTTSTNKTIRMSGEYKLWREAVFERDDYTCIWCGARNGNGKTVVLNADHIKPFYAYPELRFAIDNGRTLCRPCHKTTNTWGRPISGKIESEF